MYKHTSKYKQCNRGHPIENPKRLSQRPTNHNKLNALLIAI